MRLLFHDTRIDSSRGAWNLSQGARRSHRAGRTERAMEKEASRRQDAAAAALDEPAHAARIDRSGMLDRTLRMGAMLLEGWEAASGVVPPAARPTAVVVAGMGGSGVGGDMLRALLAGTSPVPIVGVKDYRLPAFVGPTTLLLACSYSGDTEETLSAYAAARASGASIVAVTSGGSLAGRAQADGHQVVRIPAGLPPRAALPYLMLPLLRLTRDSGLSSMGDEEVREASLLLVRLASLWGPEVAAGENPAKTLAIYLFGGLPAVYSASPLLEPVAVRWKTQLNENSKLFACANTFPELSHNEAEGWAGLARAGLPLRAVVLRDRREDPAAALRIRLARETLEGLAGEVREARSQGEGLLARLFSLIILGDLVSCYLALMAGVDPTPVEIITQTKARLKEERDAGRA